MAVPTAIKSYVKKTINRNTETKFVSIVNTFTLYNSGITTGDLTPVWPPVPLGTGENNRIGSSIRPVKLVIRGYVCYGTSNSATFLDARMLGARLMVFTEKAVKAYSSSPTNINLLDFGGTSSPYTGTAMNYLTPHNTDEFNWIADKRMKIQKPYGLTNQLTPSQANSIGSMNNSLFHPFVITLTQKHMPAVIQFEPNVSSQYPINYAPLLAMGYSDLLNGSPDTLNTQIGMAWCSTLYYKDS